MGVTMLKPQQIAAALLLGLGMASAGATDPAFNAFMQLTVGNKTTVTFGGNGTPLVSSSAPLGTPAIGNFGVTRTAQGVFMESLGGTRVPGTNTTVPVRGKLALSGQVVGKTLAKAVLVYTAWEAGSALYDIWTDAGLEFNASTGAITDPASGGGSLLSFRTGYQLAFSGAYTSPTPTQMCELWRIDVAANNPGTTKQVIVTGDLMGSTNATIGTCNIFRADGTLAATDGIRRVINPSSQDTCPSGSFVSVDTCSPTNSGGPLSEQELADRIAQQSGWPDSTITDAVRDALRLSFVQPQIVPDLKEAPLEVTFPGGVPSIDVPDPDVRTVIRVLPNGDTEETTRTTTRRATSVPANPATNSPPSIQWTEETTERRIVRAPDGTVISDEETQTETAPATDQSITCGLPNTPPCKIDEEGTPQPPEDDGGAGFELIFKPLVDCANDLEGCLPALPDLNLTFSFPSTCRPIAIPAFQPYITSIDVCQWQPMIHDLMTLLWAAAGLFGAISIVSRNPFN